jgi:hypothetical protein
MTSNRKSSSDNTVEELRALFGQLHTIKRYGKRDLVMYDSKPKGGAK